MRRPHVEISRRGELRLEDLSWFYAASLLELRDLLADDAPGVADRVGRSPYSAEDDAVDAEDRDDWGRHATPEILHLFLSAREIVLEDLNGLEVQADDSRYFRLSFPGEHANAWISALNVARLALGDVHDIEAEDMAREFGGREPSDRERAVLLIHALGELQAQILFAVESE